MNLSSAAVTVAVTAALLLFGMIPADEAMVDPPSQWDAHLIDLDVQALDQAYIAQIQKLFGGWMSDDTGQPQRAIVGARKVRRAYIAAMTEIENTRRRKEKGEAR